MEAGRSRIRKPLSSVRVRGLAPTTAPLEGWLEETRNPMLLVLVFQFAPSQLAMARHLRRLTSRLTLVWCCLLATALPVKADSGSGDDGWKFSGSAYLWAAGVEGTSAAGDEIDISFTDLLDSLDGGIMGILAARKGRWTLIGDILYLSIHQETGSTANLIGLPVKLDVDVKLRGFVSTLGVAYRVIDDDITSLDLLAGARYINLDVDFDADFGAGRIKYSDSGDALDGIIGGQALISLTDRWYLSFYGDVGAGDSKLTWQAWPGVGYRFEKVDAVAGYRHLAWETDDGDTFENLNFSGPMIGVKFRF